jgi:exonuclease III
MVMTWNVNGFWSKQTEIVEYANMESVAVLDLQETLVQWQHYPISLIGYRAYNFFVEEDFRGVSLLVDKQLASYDIPHRLH